MDMDFWSGKRVLVTGHTGFKGGWLALWLGKLGAKVCGIALPPTSNPNLFELARVAEVVESHFCDVQNAKHVASLVRTFRPAIVFHLAAQPLVRASYLDPLETFSCNIMGTANVLDALRGLDSVRVALMVTTDKVYRNLEQPYPYREDDALGGSDPYSASKAASEIVIASYRDAFLKDQGVSVTSARAGNVIGGGDWSEDRLIPDAVRAWQADETLDIRRPQAIRPWQHVLEPLHGYLTLAETLWYHSEMVGAYNFGPHTHEAATVREVVELARRAYGKGDIHYGDGSSGPHEAGWLALETAKGREALGVQPRWNLAETVTRTMDWYKAQHAGANASELCLAEIEEYFNHEALGARP
jgi:CDP-glucose 4,6-dehydratase